MCPKRSEDKLKESVPSFHHVGLRNRTQIIRCGSKCLHLLSHLIDLNVHFTNTFINLSIVKHILAVLGPPTS